MSQLLDTRRSIWGIQATFLTGASCMATVIGWAPAAMGHILTCISHPPENTKLPSCVHVEHSTYNPKKLLLCCRWQFNPFFQMTINSSSLYHACMIHLNQYCSRFSWFKSLCQFWKKNMLLKLNSIFSSTNRVAQIIID